MANKAKTTEDPFLRVEALKYSAQQSWLKLKMDPTAFSKMRLREKSPLESFARENTSLSGPALQLHVKPPTSEKGSKKKPRRRGNRKEPEQSAPPYPATAKSQLSVHENEEDGGVSLRAVRGSVQPTNYAPELARELAPKYEPLKFTVVNNSARSANASATNPDVSSLTAHQAAKVAIKLMKRERHKARRNSKSANMSGPSDSTRLDPTAPVYHPTNKVPPIGDPNTSSVRPVHGFTPYEPVRSVPVFRVLPPWRIDKANRFSPSVASQSTAFTTPLFSPGKGRWIGSPPRSAPFTAPFSTTNSSQRNSPRMSKAVERKFAQASGKAAERPAPEPEAAYILQASQSPARISSPQSLLLVLDLNGTLVHRKARSTSFMPRPRLSNFLDYCISNHSVFIWSSARPENVNRMCARLFTSPQRRLVISEWGRDTLELSTEDYNEKVQVYKRLDRIWDNESVQKRHPQYAHGGRWSQTNTVLIDDSMWKAMKQPYSHLEIPEYLGPTKAKETGKDEDDVFGQVVAYLEEARGYNDVSRFIKQKKFVTNAEHCWDWEKGQMLARRDDGLGAEGGVSLMQ